MLFNIIRDFENLVLRVPIKALQVIIKKTPPTRRIYCMAISTQESLLSHLDGYA